MYSLAAWVLADVQMSIAVSLTMSIHKRAFQAHERAVVLTVWPEAHGGGTRDPVIAAIFTLIPGG